ncbi:Rv2578c family radical SAM protein [Fodinicola feengrottensis]|uniref:Rv2578c family radical SAM protein n=1 Tax=Fodinicola feengrottensis TaxID=435914 RepID=A0ABN2IJQ1_9ACTN
MRWEAQLVNPPDASAALADGTLPLELPLDLPSQTAGTGPLAGSVVRTFDTPEFRGVTFYEVRAKSVLNRVPAASQVPFEWTVNPYRGCTHACRYCFARKTHSYLDLDTGRGFDTQVVVKVNAAEVLRRELAAPRWERPHVAMGTNTDPYQRAEGRYKLMPGIISALAESGTGFSILTKGTLIARDLPLLAKAAAGAGAGANLSIGFLDREIWRSVEPGTPSPQARLRVCGQLSDAGLNCGVLLAPVLPYLTDSDESIDATAAAIARAGARQLTGIALHLRPGAREWFMAWLSREHPELVQRYRRLYRGGTYADADYRAELSSRIHAAAQRHGLNRRNDTPGRWTGQAPEPPPPAQPEQLTLM